MFFLLFYTSERYKTLTHTRAHTHTHIVTWCPTGTIEIRLILFPVFELTVASRQRMTVKKECGSRGDQQMLVLGNLTWMTSSSPKKSPDQGEEERSQVIGWDPKTEVAPSSRQRKTEKKKLVVGQGSYRAEPKPVLRVKEDEEYFRHEEAIFFKPVLKIA